MVISMYIFVSMTNVLFLWLILLSYPAPLIFALVLVVLLSHPGPLGACIADAATPGAGPAALSGACSLVLASLQQVHTD